MAPSLRLILASIWFFSVLASHCLAQNKTDSLLLIVKNEGGTAEHFNQLIWSFVFNQPDSAIYFGNRGIDWCEKHSDDSLLASIHNRIGVAYDIKSMPDSALFHYGVALSEARKRGNRKTEGGALNNIGLIYWNKGELEKAIDNYIQSAEIFEEIDNQIGLGNTYNNIALILYEDQQLQKSRSYQLRALKIRLAANHKYGIAASYSNLAQLYTTEGMLKVDSALHYLWLSVPIKQGINDLYGLARSYHNLGDLYMDQAVFDSSLHYHSKALNIQLQIGNSEGYASTYYNIAAVYSKKKEPKSQIAYLDTAEQFAAENQDFSLLWKVFRSQAKARGRAGQYDDAYRYWVLYDNLKDSIVNLERSEQVEELETKYRTAEKDREIARKQLALTDSKLALENRNKWIIGLIGGLLSVLLFGFALFQQNKRRSQAEKDAAIIAERERGLEAIIDATEEERKRIAKDLHDGIVQSLTGLSLKLQNQFGSVDADASQKKGFDESQAILNESISEVRGISHQMMPRALSEMGLVPAMDDMLEKTLGNTDIKFQFEHHKVEGERFRENVEISLYRISQELVNNIIKHSGAKAVSVQLLKSKSHLVLVVEDNGKGFKFEAADNRNGIGLMNINSRAKAINGEVNYEPSPEHGTVATIRIPLA